MLTQPRRAVKRTAATNGDISRAAGEPPSISFASASSANNSASRLPTHLTLSSHSQPQRRYHPPAAACSGGVDREIWKCGYLRKQKHGHKRFFVLRGPSNFGPSGLEYYDSEKKFQNALKASASGGACPAKKVIYLSQCFAVNKRADSKNKYLIALYTKDEYFAVVAESEQEQEEWYMAITELMKDGKKGQLDEAELDYRDGTILPGTVFKEVWQVKVKPKGLSQTRNLMGVYRLCLSAKTIHLVKLNSETPAINLPLMNIRRCGHSENNFFIEMGGFSSIGPGEIWVQVEDSVVAQNMHITILDTMKALKAFPDLRPWSKSQPSGSNTLPFNGTCRHLGNLPSSQTRLQRRHSGCTLSSGMGSLVHLNTPVLSVGREESGSCCAHASPGSSHHTRSASLPVSHFLSAPSPISVSSSSGHGSASGMHTCPSSSSICGSPSDGGFNSSDEFCPSLCDFRYSHASCTTPESHRSTPPIREDYQLTEYMTMDCHGARTFEEESSYMERTFLKQAHSSKPKLGGGLSITQQKATQSSSFLEESNPVESKRHQVCSCLLKSAYKSYSELHHPNKPPLLSSECQKKLPKDDDYVPMIYCTAPTPNADYTPMQPRVNHPATLDIPCSSPQAESLSTRVQAEYDNYVDMFQLTMAKGFSQASPKGPKTLYFSLPRSYKALSREKHENLEYVLMSPAKPLSPPSPGEYVHMNFASRRSHAVASPPSGNSQSTLSPSQPCYQHCCSSTNHMDSLLKDRPPQHLLIAPWNPPNYTRPLGCPFREDVPLPQKIE